MTKPQMELNPEKQIFVAEATHANILSAVYARNEKANILIGTCRSCLSSTTAVSTFYKCSIHTDTILETLQVA